MYIKKYFEDLTKDEFTGVRIILNGLIRKNIKAKHSTMLNEAIGKISDDMHRQVFTMYYIQRHSQAKIAMTLYLSQETVKRYLRVATREFLEYYDNGRLLAMIRDSYKINY